MTVIESRVVLSIVASRLGKSVNVIESGSTTFSDDADDDANDANDTAGGGLKTIDVIVESVMRDAQRVQRWVLKLYSTALGISGVRITTTAPCFPRMHAC